MCVCVANSHQEIRTIYRDVCVCVWITRAIYIWFGYTAKPLLGGTAHMIEYQKEPTAMQSPRAAASVAKAIADTRASTRLQINILPASIYRIINNDTTCCKVCARCVENGFVIEYI